MRLAIDDGYTLDGVTESVYQMGGRSYQYLPVVHYKYRPALPLALYEWRAKLTRATTGKEELDATIKLLADHLVSWDVTDAQGHATTPIEMHLAKVPQPILEQLLESVTTWAPKAADAAKN